MRVRLEPAETAHDAGDSEPLAEREVTVPQERQGPGAEQRHAPALVDDRQAQAERVRTVPDCPDPLEEANVLGAAAERHVLAVVRAAAAGPLAFRQRLHRAAQRGASLEQRDVVAAVDEVERRREAREPTPDDDRFHAASRTSPEPITRSLPNADRLGLVVKTSYSRRSISSSRPT